MRRRRWDDVRRDFLVIVRKDGPDSVAHRLPVHRATVYRLVHGHTKHPSPLVKSCIETFVANATESDGIVEPRPPTPLPRTRQ